MKHVLLGSCCWLALVAALGASEATPGKPVSPADPLKAVTEEYSRLQRDYYKKYSDAKDAEERRKLLAERPDPNAFADRLLELAQKSADETTAVDALTWVVNNARAGANIDQAIELLKDKYTTSEKLGPLCQKVGSRGTRSAEAFLRKMLEKNPHREVQGQACFALARHLKRQAEAAATLQSQPQLAEKLKAQFGNSQAQQLLALDEKKLGSEIEALLKRVIESYGDVGGTLGQSAERELFEIQHLSVGCVAPEIEAEDIQGVKFKLSDYRGKVVMLDFWGDW